LQRIGTYLLFSCLLTTICKADNVRQHRKDTMQKLFLPLLIAATLISCATQQNIKADFEKNLKNYNELVRWRQFEDASLLAADSISGEYRERLKSVKNVAMVDCRVMNVTYDEKKNTAEVTVEIDYYTHSSPRMRTVTDHQKWAYQGKEGKGLWRLMSLLPEFP